MMTTFHNTLWNRTYTEILNSYQEVLMKRIVLSCLLIALMVSCGGGASTTPTPGGSGLPQITGVWKTDSGPEVFAGLGTWKTQFLQFADKGDGKVFVSQASSNLKACPATVYAVISANVVSISSRTLINSFGEASLNASHLTAKAVESFRFELPDANTLKLIAETGETQVFKKASEVATSSQCETATVKSTLEDLSVTTNRSDTDIISDGTNLRVSDGSGKAQIITLPSGALGVSEVMGPSLGQFTYGVVMQAGDYWAVCHCGGNTDITRWKPGVAAAVDTINTGTDLGKELSISSAAFDGTYLWLSGYNYAAAQYQLFKINTAAEPDVLVQTTPLAVGTNGLTYYNSKLWTLTNAFGSSLAELDETNGKATRVLTLPPAKTGTNYASLVSVGGSIYVMRYKNSTTISVDRFQP
jgi:hypothetical protein